MNNPLSTLQDYELFVYSLGGDPALQPTHPHHKHVPPDIRHDRIPAPGLSFAQPNLPFLINEIEALLADIEAEEAKLT